MYGNDAERGKGTGWKVPLDMKKGRLLLYRWASCDATCYKAVQDIAKYRELINEARDLTGVSYDGLPHGNDITKPTEQKALKVLALEDEYEAHIEYLLAQVTGDLEIKRMVDSVLGNFPPIYTQMATLRYAKGYVWSVVARTIYVSEATVRRMDKQVVDAIERL